MIVYVVLTFVVETEDEYVASGVVESLIPGPQHVKVEWDNDAGHHVQEAEVTQVKINEWEVA